MRRKARRLALAAVLLCAAGCITVGRDFNSAELGWLQGSRTGKGEVYRMLGDPFRTGVDQGKITWSYGYYRYRVFGETCTRSTTAPRRDATRTTSPVCSPHRAASIAWISTRGSG